jgi:hypothetical protein
MPQPQISKQRSRPSALASLQIQALQRQGLPYTSTKFDLTKNYSLKEWLSRLDVIIEESTAIARSHSVPPAGQKRSASEDKQLREGVSCPRKRQRRRNSFVIHRDAHGRNVKILNSSIEDLVTKDYIDNEERRNKQG